MNKTEYNEIINGTETYKEIANKLKQDIPVIIGWTDEACTHLDILFTYKAYREYGNYLQRGLMPTDLFVCEEHLKNWIIKKTFSESLLFKKKYYTNKYFITGMGYVNGERMSSSRGTAVLLKDLLDEYGSNVARMIIMFTGGHPSKMYNYTEENIKIINKMLKEFYDYVVFLNSQLLNVECNNNDFVEEFDKIYQELKDGFYQQVLVDVMKNLKKKYSNAEMEILIKVRNTLKYFMNILLPNIKI